MDKEIGFIAFTLHEAKAGNLEPLIARVRLGVASKEERELAAALLERLDGVRGRAAVLQLEKALITIRVEGLIKEEGYSKEAAVTQVAKERDRSRSGIFAAMRESKRSIELKKQAFLANRIRESKNQK
jgi:hypothetical protein